MKKQIPVILFLLLGYLGHAQHIRPLRDVVEEPGPQEMRQLADKLIEEQRHSAALEHFQKLRDEGELTDGDKVKMGEAYYQLRQYRPAADVLEQVVKTNPGAWPLVHYRLGFVYKALEEYGRSKAAFNYFTDNFAARFDKESREVYKEIKQLELASKIDKKLGNASVDSWKVRGFNSKNMLSASYWGDQGILITGVAPVKYNKKIEVTESLVAVMDSIQVSRLYNIKGSKVSKLDIQLPDISKNIGSAAKGLSPTQLYFSACDQFGGKNECQVYQVTRRSKGWSAPQKVTSRINHPGASTKNPQLVVTTEGETLFFFASNRPGGFGGYDIWVSKVENGEFQRPINLGLGVNTEKDEVTPFFDTTTGYLFISSNGHGGLGELDVFLVKVDWGDGQGKVYNLGKPINSGADDHYFSLDEDHTTGFLSSNRKDNCCDEPYRFELKLPYSFEEMPGYFTEVSTFEQFDTELALLKQPFTYEQLNFSESNTEFILAQDADIEGQLASDRLAVGNKKVLLVDKMGEVISSTVTDNTGRFNFRQLPAGGQYSFVLATKNQDLDIDVSLFNLKGQLFGKITKIAQPGVFQYRTLEDYESGVWTLEVEDATISGQLLDNGVASAYEKVLLVDQDGRIVAATQADAQGTFSFKKLPARERYAFVLQSRDVPLAVKVSITDRMGNIRQRFNSTTSKEIFKYRKLEEYETGVYALPVNDATISGSLAMGRIALGDQKVLLIDESGKILGAAYTDKAGKFTFRRLPVKGQYSFVLEQHEGEFNVDVAVLDKQGNILSRFSSSNRQEIFKYRPLEDYQDGVYTLVEEDAVIYGTLKLNDIPMKDHVIFVIDDIGNVLDRSTTNVEGQFEFRELPAGGRYAFLLQETDAQITIDLWVTGKQGDVVDRMNSKNRKEIFRFNDLLAYQQVYDQRHSKICGEIAFTEDPFGHPIVLQDPFGEEVACVETDGSGYFQFDEVPFLTGYRLILDGCHAGLNIVVEVDDPSGATRLRFNSKDNPVYFDFVDFNLYNGTSDPSFVGIDTASKGRHKDHPLLAGFQFLPTLFEKKKAYS